MQFSVPFIQTNMGKITSWARDANSRDREVSLPRQRRCNLLRPRRDVGASWDRDVETDITSLPVHSFKGGFTLLLRGM